uniref:C2H2-type domain-containing protein n=1 Tax=Anopheles farauti TaxID=69004 RepID=A0A182Q7D0_9DIPT
MDLTIYNDVLVPIFHPTTSEPLNLELITIIVDCIGVLLKPEMDFPSAACQSCLQLMQEFHHFRRRAREYDKIIRSKILPRIEPEPAAGSAGGTTAAPALEDNRCMVCGEKFQSRDVWVAHLAVHTVERPFQCHICLAQFKTKYVQQNHIRTVHENVRSYRCPICVEPIRMFKSKRTLEDHMRYHTGERPFVCCICKITFSSGSVHRNHMYRVHREMRKKDRRCNYCGKVFDRILDLKRHQTSYCEKIVGREMADRL